MPNLEKMTLVELKALAKENNLKNITKLKKDELIAVLKQVIDHETVAAEPAEEKKTVERHYDNNGNAIIDYKLTNEGDEIVEGILDILPDGYGFLRGDNYLSSDKDVYISMVQIKRFRLDTGDIIKGISPQSRGFQ